jgi:DNA-binding response OmpR family regulator
MQRIVAKIVSSYGWEPLIARDGYEAMALALEHHPDVVVLNLIMPDLTGMHVLRLLKRIPQTAEIPVLILSVATEVELLMEAMKCGAAGFIRKPFTRSTIYEKIVAILSPEPLTTDQGASAESHQHELKSQQPHQEIPSAAPIVRYQQQSSLQATKRSAVCSIQFDSAYQGVHRTEAMGSSSGCVLIAMPASSANAVLARRRPNTTID